MDLPKKRNAAPDGNVVKLNERWQVGYWTTALSCSENELREALLAVGDTTTTVREYLRKSKPK